jgi:hypothetical protein
MWPSRTAAPQAHQRKDQTLLSGDMSAVQVVSGKLSTSHKDVTCRSQQCCSATINTNSFANAPAVSCAVASCGIHHCTGGSSRDMRAIKPAGSQQQQTRRAETDVLGATLLLAALPLSTPHALQGLPAVMQLMTVSLHHADDAISPPPARHAQRSMGAQPLPVSPVHSHMAVALGTPSRSAALDLGPTLTGVQQCDLSMASEVCLVHPEICYTRMQKLPMCKWTCADWGRTQLTQLPCATRICRQGHRRTLQCCQRRPCNTPLRPSACRRHRRFPAISPLPAVRNSCHA